MSNIGVYKITNTVNGRLYIGSSSDIKHRLSGHKGDLSRGKHHSFLLQRSWDKYGSDSFKFELVELCAREELISKEQYWIDATNCTNAEYGFNRSPTAGTTAGCIKTEETKKRISESKKGTVPWNKGTKGAQKWAADDSRRKNPPNKGKTHSNEVRTKMGATKKARGQKPTKECLEASAKVRRNKKNPAAANKMKALWSDPIWRANILESRKLAKLNKKA
jgi:group I intron endonuclease